LQHRFWNTLSNVLFLVFGVSGLYMSIKYRFEQRFHLLYIMMMVVGMGSAMFHASLQLL